MAEVLDTDTEGVELESFTSSQFAPQQCVTSQFARQPCAISQFAILQFVINQLVQPLSSSQLVVAAVEAAVVAVVKAAVEAAVVVILVEAAEVAATQA